LERIKLENQEIQSTLDNSNQSVLIEYENKFKEMQQTAENELIELKNTLADEIETKLKIELYYQQKLESKNKDLHELKKNLNTKSLELQEKIEEIQKTNIVIEGLRRECFQLQDTHLKDNLLINQLSTKLSDSENQTLKLSQEIIDYKDKLNIMKEEVIDLNDKIELIKFENDEYKQQTTDIEDNVKKLEDDNNNVNTE